MIKEFYDNYRIPDERDEEIKRLESIIVILEKQVSNLEHENRLLQSRVIELDRLPPGYQYPITWNYVPSSHSDLHGAVRVN